MFKFLHNFQILKQLLRKYIERAICTNTIESERLYINRFNKVYLFEIYKCLIKNQKKIKNYLKHALSCFIFFLYDSYE